MFSPQSSFVAGTRDLGTFDTRLENVYLTTVTVYNNPYHGKLYMAALIATGVVWAIVVVAASLISALQVSLHQCILFTLKIFALKIFALAKSNHKKVLS